MYLAPVSLMTTTCTLHCLTADVHILAAQDSREPQDQETKRVFQPKKLQALGATYRKLTDCGGSHHLLHVAQVTPRFLICTHLN